MNSLKEECIPCSKGAFMFFHEKEMGREAWANSL